MGGPIIHLVITEALIGQIVTETRLVRCISRTPCVNSKMLSVEENVKHPADGRLPTDTTFVSFRNTLGCLSLFLFLGLYEVSGAATVMITLYPAVPCS